MRMRHRSALNTIASVASRATMPMVQRVPSATPASAPSVSTDTMATSALPVVTSATMAGRVPVMNVIVRIPDDLAERLAAVGGDLERRTLEALALAEYQAGRLTRPDLGRMLGFETRCEIDGFLKAHGVNEGMTVAEFEQERQVLDRLWI